MKKRIFGLLLAFVVVLSLLPVAAFAASSSQLPVGTTKNVSWTANEDAHYMSLTVAQSGYYSISMTDKLKNGNVSVLISNYTLGDRIYLDFDGAATCSYNHFYLKAGTTYEVCCTAYDGNYRNIAASISILIEKVSFTPKTISATSRSFTLRANESNLFRIHTDQSGDYMLTAGKNITSADVYDSSHSWLSGYYSHSGFNRCRFALEGNKDYYLELDKEDGIGASGYQLNLALAKESADISAISVVAQKDTISPCNGTSLDKTAFTYKIKFSNGSYKTAGFADLQTYGIFDLEIMYTGKFQTLSDGTKILKAGNQPAEISYLNGKKSNTTVYISTYVEWLSDTNPIDVNKNCYINPSNGQEGTLYWPVKTRQSGVFECYTYDWSKPFDWYQLRIFDKNNNEVPYDDAKDGWSLVKGQSYVLEFDYEFADSYKSTFKFWLKNELAPIAPAFTLSNTASGITVKWNKVADADGYQVWRKTGSGDWKLARTITSANITSYTNEKRTSGTKYQYRVRAYKTVDGMKLYSSYSTKTKYFMAQPEISSVVNTSTGITVKWGKIVGATGYRVYRKTGTGDWKLAKTITSGSTTSWTNTNRTNGTKYQYKVVAVKAVSGTNYTSVASAVKTIYRLTRPTISSATNSGTGKLTVKWDKNAKASGYQVRYIKDTTAKTVTVEGAGTLSKTLSKLTKGSTYKVYVRSYKTVSGTNYYSAWSGCKSVKIVK